jgi:hypothetical protein
MLLTWHTPNKLQNFNYDEIIICNVFFLLMIFNRDILFEMPPLSQNITTHHICKLWIENKMTMFSRKSSQPISIIVLAWTSWRFIVLGHLSYVHNDHNFFLFGCSQQDYLNYPKLAHIPIKGQMVLGPPTSLLECKFYNSLPFYNVKFIMFSIDSNPFQEQWFTLGCISTLLHMVSVERLWKKLKCWSKIRLTKKSMQKHSEFP